MVIYGASVHHQFCGFTLNVQFGSILLHAWIGNGVAARKRTHSMALLRLLV